MHAFLLYLLDVLIKLFPIFELLVYFYLYILVFDFRLYVLCVICLIGGVPRMGPRVPFALLPLGIYLSNKVFKTKKQKKQKKLTSLKLTQCTAIQPSFSFVVPHIIQQHEATC